MFFRNDKKREGTWVDFAELRRIAPLSRILSHYGLDAELKRVGSSLRGCCPIHKGKIRGQCPKKRVALFWRL